MSRLSKLSDAEIIEIVRTKDKESYSEIIKRYQEKLMRYANYLTGHEQTAADVVQEGLIKAYINLNSFDSKKNFSSWIYRIVHNQALNIMSKNKKEILIGEQFEYDSGVDLEDDLVKKELINQTHSCLKQIPLIYKEPLSLYYLEEKSYEEISDILHLPINTVGTRVSRAKKLMKKICQKK